MLQDVVCDNEFEKMLLPEVIPPDELGVTFDHIGALDNVKETLRELVMLPLQRPELFVKGQLTKVRLDIQTLDCCPLLYVPSSLHCCVGFFSPVFEE